MIGHEPVCCCYPQSPQINTICSSNLRTDMITYLVSFSICSFILQIYMFQAATPERRGNDIMRFMTFISYHACKNMQRSFSFLDSNFVLSELLSITPEQFSTLYPGCKFPTALWWFCCCCCCVFQCFNLIPTAIRRECLHLDFLLFLWWTPGLCECLEIL